GDGGMAGVRRRRRARGGDRGPRAGQRQGARTHHGAGRRHRGGDPREGACRRGRRRPCDREDRQKGHRGARQARQRGGGLMDRRRFLLGLLATGAGGGAACGYALAGHGTFLPSYIQTVGIPQFINTTPYYEVENVFSQDVRTEVINRGKYKIVPDSTGVDALLTGEILAIIIAPASF